MEADGAKVSGERGRVEADGAEVSSERGRVEADGAEVSSERGRVEADGALLGEEALLGGAQKSVEGALLEKLDLRPRRVQGCKGRSSLLRREKHLAAQQWGN